MLSTPGQGGFLVKSIKFSAFGPQKTPSLARQWGRDTAYTVSVTGFSVTLTEIFVADTVWGLCGFRPIVPPFLFYLSAQDASRYWPRNSRFAHSVQNINDNGNNNDNKDYLVVVHVLPS